MKIRSIKYHIRQGSKSIYKNGLMSVASIASVATCALMLIISLCIAINLDTALVKLEEKIGVSIYLGEEVSDQEVNDILTSLKELPNISNISYMSKQDALDWAKNEWGNDNEILDGLEDDNPFPRSFEINIDYAKNQAKVIKSLENLQNEFEIKILERVKKDEEHINNVVEKISETTTQTQTTTENSLEKNKENNINLSETTSANTTSEPKIGDKDYKYLGIEKIKHGQKQADILLAVNNTLRVISIILIFIFSILSVTIIVNTIKLTVYFRKNEINIMKYVGATDWFIRWPFVIEGILIGFIGALIPIILSLMTYSKVNTIIYNSIPIIQNYIEFKSTFEMFTAIIPVTVLFGVLLGIIGSVNSIKKHLNV